MLESKAEKTLKVNFGDEKVEFESYVISGQTVDEKHAILSMNSSLENIIVYGEMVNSLKSKEMSQIGFDLPENPIDVVVKENNKLKEDLRLQQQGFQEELEAKRELELRVRHSNTKMREELIKREKEEKDSLQKLQALWHNVCLESELAQIVAEEKNLDTNNIHSLIDTLCKYLHFARMRY